MTDIRAEKIKFLTAAQHIFTDAIDKIQDVALASNLDSDTCVELTLIAVKALGEATIKTTEEYMAGRIQTETLKNTYNKT